MEEGYLTKELEELKKKEDRRKTAMFILLDGSLYYVSRRIFDKYGYTEYGKKVLDRFYKRQLDLIEENIKI
jgi:hypothetical protein